MRRLAAPLAIGMAVLYLALAISATWCLSLDAESPTSGHHHSTSHSTHSALCAWACQANPAVMVSSVAPSSAILAVVFLFFSVAGLFSNRVSSAGFPARAPPR